jgi:hypothetical protein
MGSSTITKRMIGILMKFVLGSPFAVMFINPISNKNEIKKFASYLKGFLNAKQYICFFILSGSPYV